MNKCLETAHKTIFKAGIMHVHHMIGIVNEIVKETQEAWVKFFIDNQKFFTSPNVPPKFDIPCIPTDAKGKGIIGGDPPVLGKKLRTFLR